MYHTGGPLATTEASVNVAIGGAARFRRKPRRLQVVFGEARLPHQRALKPFLECLVAVDGNTRLVALARLCVDVVGTLDPLQAPAVALQPFAEILAGEGLQISTSSSQPGSSCL